MLDNPATESSCSSGYFLVSKSYLPDVIPESWDSWYMTHDMTYRVHRTHTTYIMHRHMSCTVCTVCTFYNDVQKCECTGYCTRVCHVPVKRCTCTTVVQLGSVGFLLSPNIKSREKYLLSRHPKHTIGNCSLRSVQIQGGQDIVSSLQKLENPESLIFFRKNALQHEKCAVS